MINKVLLIGNLGADPETRYTQDGQPVTNFRIATSDRWTSRDGQAQERTEWHRIVTFGRLAEHCRDYLSKGRQVFVEGRLQTRQWEDKEGNKRSTTEIVAQTVKFLGGRGDRDQAGRQPEARGGGATYGQADPSPGFDDGPPPIGEDDVPF